MDNQWIEEHFLSVSWQFKTLGGTVFFGPTEGIRKWALRPDYPLRYFLWKVNREAWSDLGFRNVNQVAVLAACAALREVLQGLSADVAEAEVVDGEGVVPKTFLQSAVDELDADEVLLDSLDQDWLDELNARLGAPIDWGMFGSLVSLLHIDDGVRHLASGDLGMAGAFTVKAQSWQAFGHYEEGRRTSEWLHKKRLAVSGANAAHEENRRVRTVAIEAYLARSWPSKMQAARVISKQVNRTELVVMRWIREHSKLHG